jgi:aryl carrier-like protein
VRPGRLHDAAHPRGLHLCPADALPSRRALPEPDTSDNQRHYVAPQNDAELSLAAIWQHLLRVDRVGRDDNFFELGGDSIIALQLVSRAKRAGLELLPRDVFEHPALAALAGAALGRQGARAATTGDDGAGASNGAGVSHGALVQSRADEGIPLLPIQRWFFEQSLPEPGHFNQSVLLEVPAGLDLGRLERALQALVASHPALSVRFERTDAGWRQQHEPSSARRLESFDLSFGSAQGPVVPNPRPRSHPAARTGC